ncbi:AT-rich interactive domain-containing protein 5B-like isoform X2 [Saccostrea echinata]|uniref:AT-rich interactive domain-containing protein 5B-like isoform X2 n=1 Tax=Saccostrea echinata TaxID=191078 RepID=UPI002A7F2183|nr:AT-rich interactive domain-containing protein 5B-like isoform X2 [Saccostrea echinata]
MDEQNVEKCGSVIGEHASNTFYKAIKFSKNGQYRILSLGEFFYIKITKLRDVCVGELQMIWTNKQDENQLICNVRLYLLPEHTDAGREEQHGEDEILGMSEKLILKASDLVPLLMENVTWTFGRPLYQEEDLEAKGEEFRNIFVCNKKGLNFSDVEKEKEEIGYKGDLTSTPLTILSFAQYCRYRTVLKRLENMVDKWLRNAIICAIGGIVTKNKNARIMFCKNMVDVPELDDLEIRCDHLAPSLKGRPRKKKSLTRSDSDSYETSSDVSTPGCKKFVLTGKRESALRNGLKFDNSQVSTEEQEFLFNLHRFMKKRNTPICRIPSLGFKQVDLYFFYSYAQKLGGYEMVTQRRLWKHLYDKLGGNPGSTSAATCTRRHYEKLLLPYERYDKGRNIEKKQTKPPKEELESKDREDNSCKTPTEEGQVKPRRGRKPGRPRTVKNLLDSSEKEKTQAITSSSIKTESLSREETTDPPGDRTEGSVKIKEEKESELDSESNSNVFSQSKLFQQNSVQGSSSASLSHSKAMERGVPNIPVHQAAMFYPQTFIPLGGIHHMGLPIMNQLPMGMPRFYNHPSLAPASSDKQHSFRPNILRNSQKTSSLESRPVHASSKHSGHSSSQSLDPLMPTHTQSRQPTSTSPCSSGGSSPHTLMVPPAHSNGLKRPYSSNQLHVPNASGSSFANKSLLFDFESTKRQKLDIVNSNKIDCSDEPTDLSMKTLKKKENSETNERNSTPGLTRETPGCLVKRERSPAQSLHRVQTCPAGLEHPLDIPHSVFNKRPSSVFSPAVYPNSNMVDLSKIPSSSSQSQEGPKTVKMEEKSQESRPSRSAIKGPESHSPRMKDGLPDLPPGMVHPAFLHPMMRPTVPLPQAGYFPIPLQLQQLYQAQLRASAAYDGLLQRDHTAFNSVPMFVPQMPVFSQRDKK